MLFSGDLSANECSSNISKWLEYLRTSDSREFLCLQTCAWESFQWIWTYRTYKTHLCLEYIEVTPVFRQRKKGQDRSSSHDTSPNTNRCATKTVVIQILNQRGRSHSDNGANLKMVKDMNRQTLLNRFPKVEYSTADKKTSSGHKNPVKHR